MQHIQQKHQNGCGIACIAMVANISYRKSLKLTNPKRWFWQKVYAPNIEEIRDTLASLNIGVEQWQWETPVFSALSIPVILLIQYLDNRYHVVVWDPITQSIFDPDQAFGDYDLTYYQQLSIGYLPIYPSHTI